MHGLRTLARGGMMARMLTQAPLRWLPADAEEIAPGVGVVPGGDGSGVVWVHGLATFAWDGGDEAARRLAAVQLVRLRAATRRQAAAAFGTDPVTVWRWDRKLAEGGVAALVPGRKGPRGAWKLTPELAERIRALDAEGKTLAVIAGQCRAGCRHSPAVPRWAGFRPAGHRTRGARPGQSPPPGKPGKTTRPPWLRISPPAGSRRCCRCCRIRRAAKASGRWPGSGSYASARR